MRKDFTPRTKKIEWMRAARRDPFSTFVKTSKCRRCWTTLKWGDGRYNFDHKDSNPARNTQANCYLVCRNCHGAVTKFGSRVKRDRLTGMVVGRQRTKKKVGYKKDRRKRVTKKIPIKDVWGYTVGYRTSKRLARNVPKRKTRKKRRTKKKGRRRSSFDPLTAPLGGW